MASSWKQGKTPTTNPSPYPLRTIHTERSNITISDLTYTMTSDSDQENDQRLENLDPNSPLTIGLLTKVLRRMELNLNRKMDRIVGDIREDVS